jgi:hypothetical protein
MTTTLVTVTTAAAATVRMGRDDVNGDYSVQDDDARGDNVNSDN